jgi:hypothetical protein
MNNNLSKLSFDELKTRYGKMKTSQKLLKTQAINKTQIEKLRKKHLKDFNELSFAIIVPYRDNLDGSKVRHKQLTKFIKYMPTYFKKLGKNYKFKIIIVEQGNKKKFNRGVLLNVGFLLAEHNVDYFIFHDIDLFPDKDMLHYYGCYPFKPIHLAHIWTKYGVGGKYFGGVNSFNKADFRKINGFPNDYWGWGGEDDELYDRVVNSNLTVINPKNGKYKEMEHDKPMKEEENPFPEKMRLRLQHDKWKENGLNNVKYTIVKNKKDEKVTKLNAHSVLVTINF